MVYFQSTFKITRGDMNYFVGFQINRCELTGSIFVHQERFRQDTLFRFGLPNAYKVSISVDTHAKLCKNKISYDVRVM